MSLQTNNAQEAAYLKEALVAVKVQSKLMKLCLVKYSNKRTRKKKLNLKKDNSLNNSFYLGKKQVIGWY